MSYYQGHNVHHIQEYVPTYQLKSDYLPNRVTEGERDNQASEVVNCYFYFSCDFTNRKREEDTSTPIDQSSSTLTGTGQSGSTKMWKSISPSANNNSAEWSGDDLFELYLQIILNFESIQLYLTSTKLSSPTSIPKHQILEMLVNMLKSMAKSKKYWILTISTI